MRKMHTFCASLLTVSILLLSGCKDTALRENTGSSPASIVFEAQDMEGNAVSSEIFSDRKSVV